MVEVEVMEVVEFMLNKEEVVVKVMAEIEVKLVHFWLWCKNRPRC